MNIRQIRVFIASPGGLEDERKAAFEEVERIDRSIAANFGGNLRPYGWERSMSGRGRAQELINREMETCDLFIGIMGQKWGTPPGLDDRFSSGFEEEWELSLERSIQTGSPVMTMLFKAIPKDQQEDPGLDVQRVLDFKKRLRDGKIFFYKEFASTSEFLDLVRDFLSRQVIEMLRQDLRPPEQIPATASSTQSVGRSANDTVTPAASESAAFLEAVSRQILSRHGPDAAHVARMRLIAAAARVSGNDTQVIGIHDANLLHAQRSTFNFTFAERRTLLEAGLSSIESESVPVWSWLASVSGGQAEKLQFLTVYGEEAERVGAIVAMRLLHLPVVIDDTFGVERIEAGWLGAETETAVRVAALRYFAEIGSREQLDMVQREANLADKDTLPLAIEAALSILLRTDEVQAARHMLVTPFETLDAQLLRQVLSRFDQLGTQELVVGLDHRSGAVRAVALEKLSDRGALDRGVLDRAMEDEDAAVRVSALRGVERNGKLSSLDEVYEVLSKPAGKPRGLFMTIGGVDVAGVRAFERYRWSRLQAMAVDELKNLVAAPLHRDAAYRALAARRVEAFATSLRSDLLDGFETYFARHWPDGIQSVQQSGLLFSLSYDPEKAKKRELIHEATEVVLAQRDAADLVLVRELVDRQLVEPGSTLVSYLSVLGDSGDISRLASVSPFNWLRFQDFDGPDAEGGAARAILRLHLGSFDELMAIDLPVGMRAKLIDEVAPSEFAKLTDDQILQLLQYEDRVRRATARKVAGCVERDRIGRIEAAYRTREDTYFYQVIYWLDLGLAFDPAKVQQVLATKT